MHQNALLANGERRRRILLAFSFSLAYLFISGPTQANSHVPILSSDHEVASAGYFQLSWETETKRVELQEANTPAFQNSTTLYVGPDRKAVISGKPNGRWYYRVRTLDSPTEAWSEPVSVLVAHHDLSRALMFLSLGIVVFVATVVMIARGERGR